MKYVAAVILSFALANPGIAAIRSWTGATDGLWSEPSNWDGGGAPFPGDDLVFGDDTSTNLVTNDFQAGTAFNSLTFDTSMPFMFVVTGESITLGAGGITKTADANFRLFMTLSLTASQTWNVAAPGRLTILSAPIALGANMLTITGSGSHAFNTNTITGTGGITVDGSVELQMNLVDMSYTGPTIVEGAARLQLLPSDDIATPIVVNRGGVLLPFGAPPSRPFGGVMNAPLTVNPGGTYEVIITGTANSQYSSLTVNAGPITLGGDLEVLNSVVSPIGTVFTIIANQTGSAVVGTFADLPEGALLAAGAQTFRISYLGGDYQRDVTLTTVLPPSGCTYSLAPTDLSNTPPAGGPTSIIVTTPGGCPVTVTLFQPWVTVNSITPSGGSSIISLQIDPNPGAARATSIFVADQLLFVSQFGP